MSVLFSELTERARRRPADPLVTWYGAAGERAELSATTFANAVAKTAGFIVDELDAEPGDTIRLELPLHWQLPVWLAAAEVTGLDCTVTPGSDIGILVIGSTAEVPAAGVPAAGEADPPAIVVTSLHPFGLPVAAVPEGMFDHARLVMGQPDAFLHPPLEGRLRGPDGWIGGGDLAEVARRWSLDRGLQDGCRLLCTAPSVAFEVALAVWAVPLVTGGSVVLAAAGDSARIATAEAATAIWPEPE